MCWLSSHDFCLVCGKDAEDWFEERPSYCPLIELPDHGDLVDRDDLRKLIPSEEIASRFAIENANVIIQAERSEE